MTLLVEHWGLRHPDGTATVQTDPRPVDEEPHA